MLCRRSWTERMLWHVEERIAAPLEMIPPGMITPEVIRLVLDGAGNAPVADHAPMAGAAGAAGQAHQLIEDAR